MGCFYAFRYKGGGFFKLWIYLGEVRKLGKLLDINILTQAREDEYAMGELIMSEEGTKFIRYVIKTYTKSPVKFMLFNRVEYEELMNIGRAGLFKGIRDADLSRDAKEIQKYLYLRVQGEIREISRSNNSNQVVIPQRLRGMYPKYLKFHNEFYENNYRDPSIGEVMSEFCISEDDAYDLVYGMQASISDTVESGGEYISLFDIIKTRHLYTGLSVEQSVINKIMLEEKLAVLNKKERTVLEMKYLMGYKNVEIARFLNCGSSMVAKHLNNSIRKINMGGVL
jgi:RNA polymerase sigma factor (sigma-70 family)